ncbi:MAG: hypothetical protein GX868_13745 [Actinobacteria bacterium]|nr:hypothetical protein [Actinomycetota bacterium]
MNASNPPSRSATRSSWLGDAWQQMLNERSGIDPQRLAAGRNTARSGDLGALIFEPGVVRAANATVEFDIFNVETWGRVFATLEMKAAHVAALADNELDPSILADLERVGISLLPGVGEIRTSCTCAEWAEPCRHAAAILLLIAGELARDPLAIVVIRGQRRDEFLAEWAALRGVQADEEPVGVLAVEAWSGTSLDDIEQTWMPTIPLELSGHLRAPSVETTPMPWEVRLSLDDPIDPSRVDELALDATERAWLMLSDGVGSGLDATVHGDLARRALTVLHSPELTILASRVRHSVEVLRSWAAAWQLGGDIAVEVLADPRSRRTDQQQLAGGRDALVELGIPRRSVALNYDSLGMPGGIKLVVGADGRWYRIHSEAAARGRPETWYLDAPPSTEIEDLIKADELL